MIIILHGTSSSGKTSVAIALLKLLPDPYFFFGYDQFLKDSMPSKLNMEIDADMILLDRAISGFNKSLKFLASEIDFFVLDHVLVNQNWLVEISDALRLYETFFVAIKAPLKVIEDRENKRCDRKPGTAREQYENAYKYNFDLIVDTSTMNPEQCAQYIIEHLKVGTALQSYSSS